MMQQKKTMIFLGILAVVSILILASPIPFATSSQAVEKKPTQADQITIDFVNCGKDLSPDKQELYLKTLEQLYGTIHKISVSIARNINLTNKNHYGTLREFLIQIQQLPGIIADHPDEVLFNTRLEYYARDLDNFRPRLAPLIYDPAFMEQVILACLKTLKDTAFHQELANNIRKLVGLLDELKTEDIHRLDDFLQAPHTRSSFTQNLVGSFLLRAIIYHVEGCTKACCMLLHNELIKMLEYSREYRFTPIVYPMRLTNQDRSCLTLLNDYYHMMLKSTFKQEQKPSHVQFKFYEPKKEANIFLKQIIRFLNVICNDLIDICAAQEKAVYG